MKKKVGIFFALGLAGVLTGCATSSVGRNSDSFNRLDGNADGMVCEEEMQAALQAHLAEQGRTLDSKEISIWFDRVDADGNELIDFSEYSSRLPEETVEEPAEEPAEELVEEPVEVAVVVVEEAAPVVVDTVPAEAPVAVVETSTPEKVEVSEKIKNYFSKRDENGNGQIDLEEQMAFAEKYASQKGKPFSEKHAKKRFGLMDLDGDGSISLDEFVATTGKPLVK